MRDFSAKERQLIKQIVKNDTFYFRDFFSKDFLENVRITVPLKNDERIKKLQHSERIEYRQIATSLITSIKLLHLLEAQGWIYGFKVEALMYDSFQIGAFENIGEIERNSLVTDQFIKDELAVNAQREFVVTEALKVFVENGFRTKEDILANRNSRFTKVGLWLAGMGTLVALTTTAYTVYENQEIHRDINRKLNTLDTQIEKLDFRGSRYVERDST